MKTNKSAGVWCLNSSDSTKSYGKQSIATYVLDFSMGMGTCSKATCFLHASSSTPITIFLSNILA